MKNSNNRFGSDLVAGTSCYAPDGHAPTLRSTGLNNWVLNLTVEGRGRVNSGAAQFFTREGDILLFPPHVAHDYAHAPKAACWKHVWIYFNPPGHLVRLLHWPAHGAGVLGFSISDAWTRKRVRRAMERCLALYSSPHRNRLAFCANALEEALLWCDTLNPFSSGSTRDERIEQTLAYMIKNFAKDLTASMLAKECHLSVSRFAHLFRQTTDTSPLRYLENLRIWKAQELLIGTNRSVKEISQDVGFADPLYFSKVFRKNLGAGPRDFRKESRARRETRES